MNSYFKKGLLVYLLLLFFLAIAYFPLSSFLFALKNDALTANFPNKYFFSAALHDGYLPVWNPYLNFGFPLYADPGFSFWNPITWLFGWLGYTVPMLSVEILFYIWIGGIGAYELGKWLGHSEKVSFCMGMMYMCCGFYIGNLQHINFLTSAAFLPLVLLTYLDLQAKFGIRKLFYCLLCIYMLATGGHPAVPMATIYFLFFIQIGIILFSNTGESKLAIGLRSLKTFLILLGSFLILAAPLIDSYYEIYPVFTRAVPVVQIFNTETGFDPGSYISFLYPFSTSGGGNLFKNDPLMRNGYFSIVGFLCLLAVIRLKKNLTQKVFLFSGAFMLILSLGGPVKSFLYQLLPLLDHVRTNGEFRVFGILSFIIAGSYFLAELMDNSTNSGLFRRMLIWTAGICVIIILARFIFIVPGTLSLNRPPGNPVPFFQHVKMKLDALTFYDRIFINAVISLILILSYLFLATGTNKSSVIVTIVAADLIIFSWIMLPVTGVQILSPTAIEKNFETVPRGIPIPGLEPISENQFHSKKLLDVIGCWSYYSKQPGTPELCNYPSRFNETVAYFNSTMPETIKRKPFIFIKGQEFPQKVLVLSFTPSEFNIQVETNIPDSLIILQNNYAMWMAEVNGKSTDIQRAAISFMSVPLEKGINRVRFFYKNQHLKYIVILCIFLWVLFSILTFYRRQKQQRMNSDD
jgi:hypothetical protein